MALQVTIREINAEGASEGSTGLRGAILVYIRR